MAIFRGVGGSGDSSDNSFLQEVTAQANAASASASAASASAVLAQASANSILTLTAATGDAGTDVSYNASTGVLTVPRGADGTDASVTAANVTGVLTGGTGISIASNGTITNDSPDQTVSLTGAGGTSVTGTYPNFTITSSSTLTDAQIKTAYENNADTNAFTDADHTKLDGIEANATADQTGSEIKSAYEAVADTNAFTDAEKTKLSGIEANADVTDATNVTSAGAAMLASSPTFTGTITAPNLNITTSGSLTTNISTGTGTSGQTKTVNIGDGFSNGGTTTINLGASSGTAISKVKVYGDFEVTGDATGVSKVSQTQWYDTLTHSGGGTTTLTTTYKDIGPEVYAPATETAAKTKIDFQMAVAYSYAYSTTSNDGYYRIQVEAPNPSNEDTQYFGVAPYVHTSTNGAWQFSMTGDLTQYLTPFSSFATNSAGTTGTFGSVVGYWYSESANLTVIRVSQYQANKPSQTAVYHHPFGWESAGTLLNTPTKYIDAPYGSSHTKTQSYIEYLGKFKSSVAVQVQARESSNSGSGADNISIDDINGMITKVED